MSRIGRSALTLALAVGGVAAMSVAVASTADAATPACSAASIKIWMSWPGGVAAGTQVNFLEFSNVSATACKLDGYAAITAETSTGQQIGNQAEDSTISLPASVTLQPGGTAHAALQIEDVGNYPASTCDPESAIGVLVELPGQTQSTQIPLSFDGCQWSEVNYLTVDPISSGVGIPQYSAV